MSDQESVTKEEDVKPRKKRLWLKVLMALVVLFFVFIGGVYFYVTSATFIRSEVLVGLQNELNQPVTAGDISFSPFSHFEMHDIHIGDDPFLKAGTLSVDYDLVSLFNGKLIVNGMRFSDVDLNVVINRDGTPNILASRVEDLSAQVKTKKDKGDKPEKQNVIKDRAASQEFVNPLELILLQDIKFENVNLRLFKDDSDPDKRFEFKLKDFNFNLPKLTTNQNFNLDFKGALEAKAGKDFLLKRGAFQGNVNSTVDHNLKSFLLDFNLVVTDLAVESAGEKLAAESISIQMDLSFENEKLLIKKMVLEDGRENSNSKISLSGSAEADKSLDLTFKIEEVDKALLDLATPALLSNPSWQRWQAALKEATSGKVSGFGDTLINYTCFVTKEGEAPLSLKGELAVDGLPLVKQTKVNKLVPFQTKAAHHISIKEKEKLITVESISLKVKAEDRDLVMMGLKDSLTIDVAGEKPVLKNDGQVDFSIDRFDLSYLKPFVKEKKRQGLKSGIFSMSSMLKSQNNGADLDLVLKSLSIKDFALEAEAQVIDGIEVDMQSRLAVKGFKAAELVDFQVAVFKDDQPAFETAMKGNLDLDTFDAGVTVKSLNVLDGLDSFIPENLKSQLGLDNLNLSGRDIYLTYKDGNAAVQGRVSTEDLRLGGTTFENIKLSQSTSFDLVLNKDKTADLKQLDLALSSPSFKTIHVRTYGELELPEPGKKAKSTVSVKVPSVIEADSLLALLKKQEPVEDEGVKKKSQDTPKKVQTSPKTSKGETTPEILLKASLDVKKLIFKGQALEDIYADILVDGQQINLSKAKVLIDDALLNADATLNNGPNKSLSLKVTGSGFMSMTAVNNILNADTDKAVSGQVEVLNINAASKGKDNDQLIENFTADSVVNLKNIEITNYAQVPSFLSAALDGVLGVNPDKIEFYEGKVDVKVANKTLTIDECRFQGKAFMVNPTGSLMMTDKDYVVNMNAGAGFGGGDILQFLASDLGKVLQQRSKINELDEFRQHFSYSESSKLFEMGKDFNFSKTIPIASLSSSEGKSSLTSDFLSSVLTHAGQLANINQKDISRIQKLAKGEVNLLDEGLRIGLGELEKRQRRKSGDDKSEDEKKSVKDDLVDTLFNIFDRKKKPEPAPKEPEKVKEEPKKEEKPIDRKNELIKGLENLFK